LEKCTNCKDTHALSTMEQPHPRNVLLKLHMNIALEKDPGAWIRHGKKNGNLYHLCLSYNLMT
jgi:hypothetical protein